MKSDHGASDWPQSIRAINDLKRDAKESIYKTLIPEKLVGKFGIALDDRRAVRIACPADTRAIEMSVFRSPHDSDPLFYLHMADTLNFQIAILLFVVNDIDSERYNIDIDDRGLPTRFGTVRRNIPEEIRAMAAGLIPGQIYKGLRLSGKLLPVFETFMARTGHDIVIIEPLNYANAITYEKYGFAYYQGRQRMERIDEGLRPGGEYFEALDGSNPFRARDAWKTIRGRAWAIHDGILDEPFGDIRMYKRIGYQAGINSFPDGEW